MRMLDFALALLARAFQALFCMLPESIALAGGRLIGELIGLAQRHHVDRIATHHTYLFGQPPANPRRFLRKYYRHLGLLFVEFLRIPLITEGNLEQKVDMTPLTPWLEYTGAGNALLCTGGHVGNWELTGHTAALAGLPLQTVARPLDSPSMERWARKVRESGRQRIFSKWNVLRALKRCLAEGSSIAMLVDQHAKGRNALWVYLGDKLAATGSAITHLHLVSRAPILIGSVMRQSERGGYKLELWGVVEWVDGERSEANQKRILQAINDGLAIGIRRYPEQWLWSHRRWREPPEEVRETTRS